MSQPRRSAWLDQNLYPFQDHYIEVDGCRVHYLDEGAGPVLLFLHGNPTWSFLYRDIVKGLSGRFRCVALDYPGFGLSIARDGYGFKPAEHSSIVEKFVLALNLTDLTLMVQDWGGPIGLGLAGRQPDRVRALVIGNTWAWPVDGDPRLERFSQLVGGPIGGFFILNFNAFVNLFIPRGVRRHKLTPQVMAAYRGPFPTRASRTPTHIFSAEIVRSQQYLREVEAGLRRLTDRPVLIVWGDQDFAFREKERQRFEQIFPRHRTVILRGAGHFIQEDAADEIIAAMVKWWHDDVKQVG
jgi:haloalkane dehalogenase